jgi:hypothetical protein
MDEDSPREPITLESEDEVYLLQHELLSPTRGLFEPALTPNPPLSPLVEIDPPPSFDTAIASTRRLVPTTNSPEVVLFVGDGDVVGSDAQRILEDEIQNALCDDFDTFVL